jgi:hypothetical protein
MFAIVSLSSSLNKRIKGKVKGKGKVYPKAGHEGPKEV